MSLKNLLAEYSKTITILTKSLNAIHLIPLYAAHVSSSFYSPEILNVFHSWENAMNVGFICH